MTGVFISSRRVFFVRGPPRPFSFALQKADWPGNETAEK